MKVSLNEFDASGNRELIVYSCDLDIIDVA